MQQTVTLNDQEVTEAIIEYASKHGVKFEGMQAEVSVIAGRKENGTYATIDLKPKVIQQNAMTTQSVGTLAISKSNEVFEENTYEEEESEIILSDGFEGSIPDLTENEPDEEEELFL